MAENNPIVIVFIGGEQSSKHDFLDFERRQQILGKLSPSNFSPFEITITTKDKTRTIRIIDAPTKETEKQERDELLAQTDIIVVCFSLVSQSSYDEVENVLIKEVNNLEKKVPTFLLGIGTDLRNSEDVLSKLSSNPISEEQGKELAKKISAKSYFECELFGRNQLQIIKDFIEILDEELKEENLKEENLKEENLKENNLKEENLKENNSEDNSEDEKLEEQKPLSISIESQIYNNELIIGESANNLPYFNDLIESELKAKESIRPISETKKYKVIEKNIMLISESIDFAIDFADTFLLISDSQTYLQQDTNDLKNFSISIQISNSTLNIHLFCVDLNQEIEKDENLKNIDTFMIFFNSETKDQHSKILNFWRTILLPLPNEYLMAVINIDPNGQSYNDKKELFSQNLKLAKFAAEIKSSHFFQINSCTNVNDVAKVMIEILAAQFQNLSTLKSELHQIVFNEEIKDMQRKKEELLELSLGKNELHTKILQICNTEDLLSTLNKTKNPDIRMKMTGLHLACLHNSQIDVIRILVISGADVNALDNKTPLHYACENQVSFEIIQYLLDKGSDPNLKSVN
ncbi:rho family gtpase [Anaeramoeba ignava]|uniref:Rho family gtpase n=1 Tax=Anaeramoeba ignava TaxID=1746090 RepID=A0A9Q0L8G3_ANAIG|nr:rho family gtpase [Anaeramoeba ignava]